MRSTLQGWMLGCLIGVFLLMGSGFLRSVRAQQSSNPFSPLINKTVGVTRWQPIGSEAEQQGWIADALQRLTTKDLTGIGEINLLSVEQYQQRLDKAGIGAVNPNEADNARRIMKKTGADVLLIGTYQIKNQRIQLSAAFYNPQTEKTLAATNKLGSLGLIKSLQTAVVTKLLRKADITLGTSERNWLNRNKKLEAPGVEFEKVTPRPELFRENKTPALAAADTEAKRAVKKAMFVGVHYPGASIGFRTSRRASFELRGSANSDITVLGGRLNYHVFQFGSSNLFLGLQGSHIDFVGEVSEGSGVLGGGYLGFQQYFSEYFSFRTDFGGYLISLEDDATGVSESGLGFAVNTGVALHFL